MIPCHGTNSMGRRVGSRHSWNRACICIWCGRTKEFCTNLGKRIDAKPERIEQTQAERAVLRKHGFL